MYASISMFQIFEKYMWKSSFFTEVTRFKPATFLKRTPIKVNFKDFEHRFTKTTFLKWTPLKLFVKDFDHRFTKTILDWGISRTDYFLGTPSTVACKINIKSPFPAQRFSEKPCLNEMRHKSYTSHWRTRSYVLNKNKLWFFSI